MLNSTSSSSSLNVIESSSSRSAYFNIIIALGPQGEFGLRNSMPWGRVKEDLQYFSRITTGTEKETSKNAIIMGRKTFETLNCQPLPNRLNIIISRTLTPSVEISGYHQNLVFPFLDQALKLAGKLQDEKILEKVFVIGGVELVSESLAHPSCEAIHLTSITPVGWNMEHDTLLQCEDKYYDSPDSKELNYFPDDYKETGKTDIVKTINNRKQPVELRFRYFTRIRPNHPENAFLDLLHRIMKNGKLKPNRTGIPTLGLWGEQVRFDLSTFPLITTRRISFRIIVEELLFFLSGKTQSKVLEEKGVKIWMDNTRRKFLDKRGLTQYQEGDLGKSYPLQWRHFGAECRPNEQLELGQGGIDQIKNVIEDIRKVKENPEYEAARRLLVTAWNPTNIKSMALPCCHDSFQFQVDGDNLNCLFRMRSSDTAIGLPCNIAFYALLTYMIGHIVGLQPGTLVASLSDAHIYANCLDQIKEQISRSPRLWPKLKIIGTYASIDDFRSDSFQVVGYYPHNGIKMQMAA